MNYKLSASVVASAILFLCTPAYSESANIRIVDVGPGLCIVANFPGGYDLLYDAGHWQSKTCEAAVTNLVEDDHLEMVVISHPDSDHLGELPKILEEVSAGLIIHTGRDRPRRPQAWLDAVAAIEAAAVSDDNPEGAEVINLSETNLTPGTTWELGEATVTFVAGWGEWDGANSDVGKMPSPAELRNIISIVMRVEYAGQSVLLPGDTIGRRNNDRDPEACRDAEKLLVNAANEVPIASDVLIAPHHGGNNGGSKCFLETVDPEYVIYSAGHNHEHPRRKAVDRAIATGVDPNNIFRTDRGDDEGHLEYAGGRIDDCKDKRGDDAVNIELSESGVSITYASPTDDMVCSQ